MPNQPPKARVLIIDDNTDIHEDFRKILCSTVPACDDFEEMEMLFGNSEQRSATSTDVDIEYACQGAEGFEKVRQSLAEGNPFSLAFVDIRMPPGWDGVQTTKRIWELDPEIQIVICSAFSDYSWQDMASELGHSDRFLVLKKPFESVEVRQLVAALHHRWFSARSDSLTGLMNRNAFLEHFERQCKSSKNERFPVSCCLIDLDFFKHINDLHGHAAGDIALRQVGRLLKSRCRKGDHVARYGGEEFCVMLRDADEGVAAEWAEQTLEAIRNLELEIDDGKTIQITASLGVAELEQSNGTPLDTIKCADMSMLFAKQSGRNRVASFSDISNDLLSDSAQLKNVFHGVTASNIMNPVDTVAQSTRLKQAATMLVRKNISSAPVVDAKGQLVGLLSEGDLLQQFLDDCPNQATSHQVMQTSVIYFHEDTPLREIYDFLIRVAIPQVVIVRDHRPVGVIARATLLGWLCSRNGSVLPGGSEENCPLSLPG